ncbi:MAG: PEP-CTERM sorting domain-containing protein [Gemmatimonas sp.]
MKKRFLTLGLLAALAAPEANAQVLLNDTFSGENGGATMLNYNSFANWTVTGQVDLIGAANGYGISCSGSCVDMSGSAGPGRMTSNPFAFVAGDVMRVSGHISGNQRNTGLDNIKFGALFGGGASIGDYEFAGLVGGTGSINGPTSEIAGSTQIAGNAGFTLWSFQFQALSAGTVSFYIDAPDASSIGPILDDVLVERVVSQSVVPEPSTYAMLAFGLGAVAFAARRRTRVG